MSDQSDKEGDGARGFLGRKHFQLRFDELSETFFARVILAKCPLPLSTQTIEVSIDLSDLFRAKQLVELRGTLSGVKFELSNKNSELVADFLSALTGASMGPPKNAVPVEKYFTDHMRSRFNWLRDGDNEENKRPKIEGFSESADALPTFTIRVKPTLLAEELAKDVLFDLELNAQLMRKIVKAGKAQGLVNERVDYRRQVNTLIEHLDQRQRRTGEVEFPLYSNGLPFRWLLQDWSQASPGLTLPAIGTTGVNDKVLLPLLLEINGLLDIDVLDFDSDPLEPNNVVVRYYVRRPAARNIFGVTNHGLEPSVRARLSETELAAYSRVHQGLRDALVFGGKPRLELSFGTLASWLIRKAAYCLEEPTFLKGPAVDWLARNVGKSRLDMEDGFFLPAVYERLRDEFGNRSVKKPERFGGEIDILFDDLIPLELKVRREKKGGFTSADLDLAFRAGAQSAAYSAISRVGVVAILDLPEGTPFITNLDSCVYLQVREPSGESEFPTCVVVVVFHCHHQRPSTAR